MNDIAKFQPRFYSPRAVKRWQFSSKFIDDLRTQWEKSGIDALRILAVEEPNRFAGLCAALLPDDVSKTLRERSQ